MLGCAWGIMGAVAVVKTDDVATADEREHIDQQGGVALYEVRVSRWDL